MTAFLIPYYNHPKTIAPLVELLGAYNLDIIIVDDGSNVESKQALQAIYAHNNPKIHIITREQSRMFIIHQLKMPLKKMEFLFIM